VVRHLIVLAIALNFALSLACGLFVLTPRAQPQSEIMQGLSICEGLACYWGIIPGKSLMKDAVKELTSFPNSQFDGQRVTGVPATKSAYLLPTSDYRVVELGINPTPNTVTLISVLSQFGRPCCLVKVKDFRGDLILLTFENYPRLGIWVSLEQTGNYWAIRPETPVKQVMLCSSNIKDCMPWFSDRPYHGWHGFKLYPTLP
jgi:hypothetical protein